MRCGSVKIVLAATALFSVLSFAALPQLKVTTRNNAAINSSTANRQGAGNCQSANTYSHKYVAMQLTLTDANSRNNITVTSYADSIRGRGNSTWAVDAKKPYRIKFEEKQSMFGLQKNRSWALLANYYDATFALNAVGFELGKRLGLPGTPAHFMVDLYINNTYKGIYQLTDLVQVNKGRVDIDEKEGWLVEFDYHCPSDADEIDFNTDYPSNGKLHSFIKSPELESNFSINNPAVSFVKDQVNQLTTTMFNKSGFPENGYRDLVDLESFAKYIMIEMFMDNFDFNNKAGDASIGFAPASNFLHKDKGKKIVAGPLWDLDLAAAVEKNNFPKHYQTYQNPIKPKHPFHLKFFDDPVFLAKWKKNWDKHKKDFQAMPNFMDSIATHVEGSVVNNFTTQNGSSGGGGNPWGGGGGCYMMCPEAPTTVQAYKTEVGKLKTWWNNRITYFDQQVSAMNIDTSKDIEDTPSSSSRPSSSSSSSLSSSSSSLQSSSSSLSSSSSSRPSSSSSLQSSSSLPSSSSSSRPSSSSSLLSSSSRPSSSSLSSSSLPYSSSSSSLSSSSSSLPSSSSSDGVSPVLGYSQAQHGIFVRGKNINIHTQEPSSVKLSVFDLRGKMLFSGNLGTGSNIAWNSESLGMSKVLMVMVEAKGESGKIYKFTGRILP